MYSSYILDAGVIYFLQHVAYQLYMHTDREIGRVNHTMEKSL